MNANALIRKFGVIPAAALASCGPGSAAPPPAPAPVPVASSLDARSESALVNLQVQTTLSAAGDIMPVWSSSRPWNAIDVFLLAPAAFFGANAPTTSMAIRVWAVVAGQRSLVSIGRVGTTEAAGGNGQAVRVIAYRGPADRFDVELSWRAANTTGNVAVQVAIIAADDANDDPSPMLGAQVIYMTGGKPAPWDSVAGASGWDSTSNFVPGGEPATLVAVQGINQAAAPRYLCIWDKEPPPFGAAPGAAETPQFVFGLPQATSVFLVSSDVLASHKFTRGITILASTTPIGFVAPLVTETLVQGWVR